MLYHPNAIEYNLRIMHSGCDVVVFVVSLGSILPIYGETKVRVFQWVAFKPLQCRDIIANGNVILCCYTNIE